MIEVLPYERCKLKIGILIGTEVRFYKFAPPMPTISFYEMSNPDNYMTQEPIVYPETSLCFDTE